MTDKVEQPNDNTPPEEQKDNKKYKRIDNGQCKKVRKIPEIPGGEYDLLGFYNLPDGSFYDPDGYHFDKDGLDEFGGQYDSDNNYIPGDGNKHLFEDYQEQEYADEDGGYDKFENDELARQFEGDYGNDYDNDDYEDPEVNDSKQI